MSTGGVSRGHPQPQGFDSSVRPLDDVHVLGVDLGGTHLRCALVSSDGAVSARQRIDTPTSSPDAGPVIEFIYAAAAGADAAAVVIGLPGRVDYEHGCLERAPNLPVGWVRALNETELAKAVGLPVSVANDADLAAVGEAWFGAGRAWSDVVYLTVSTGVGAGVVLGDQLVHGRRSLAEIGECPADQASLQSGAAGTSIEDLASGTALGRRAARAGLVADGPNVIRAIKAGDTRLTGVWEDQVRAIGLAVVNLTWLFTPEAVVVGGGLGLVGRLLLEPISEFVSRVGPPLLPKPIAVVPAALGDDAGLVGAAAWHRAFRPEAAGRSTPAVR